MDDTIEPRLDDVDRLIAELETEFSTVSDAIYARQALSEGDCTNGCTMLCTNGCTNTCTGKVCGG